MTILSLEMEQSTTKWFKFQWRMQGSCKFDSSSNSKRKARGVKFISLPNLMMSARFAPFNDRVYFWRNVLKSV